MILKLDLSALKSAILSLEAVTPSDVDQCGFRVDAWFRYREMRNNTSHTYDHVKANAVCADIHAFLEDAKKLYSALERRNA